MIHFKYLFKPNYVRFPSLPELLINKNSRKKGKRLQMQYLLKLEFLQSQPIVFEAHEKYKTGEIGRKKFLCGKAITKFSKFEASAMLKFCQIK